LLPVGFGGMWQVSTPEMTQNAERDQLSKQSEEISRETSRDKELRNWIEELEEYESSKEIIPYELEKAFYCESHGQHREDGKILTHSNGNGTIDVGIAQLNEVHFPRMRKMELDPYIKEDNIAFAKILYEEEGLEPWYGITENLTCSWKY